MAFQAPGDGSEAAEQGVLRAQHRILVMAIGREPGRPAPPSPRVARHREAIRAGEMVSGEVVSVGWRAWRGWGANSMMKSEGAVVNAC
jgi:hypothetical protein